MQEKHKYITEKKSTSSKRNINSSDKTAFNRIPPFSNITQQHIKFQTSSF